jgi:hypothetical protein
VYSRPIKVYQGIDNPIQILVRNQDQKSIDLTGYALQVDIQDPVNKVTVASFAVNYVDVTKGTGTCVLDQATIDQLEQRFYKLTVKRIDSGTNVADPVYIDDNYGVPLDLQVLPAYYADMAPAPITDETVLDAGTI